MMIIGREINGLINVLRSSKKKESFIEIVSESDDVGLGKGSFGFTFVD
jgi:hypothetical protein